MLIKQHQVRIVEGKTASSEAVEGLMDILKRYNNNGGSCDIEEIKKYIEKEVLEKTLYYLT